MEQIIAFFKLCAYILGVVGGIGYACYDKAYVIAVAVAVLGWMAFPAVEDAWDKLTK